MLQCFPCLMENKQAARVSIPADGRGSPSPLLCPILSVYSFQKHFNRVCSWILTNILPIALTACWLQHTTTLFFQICCPVLSGVELVVLTGLDNKTCYYTVIWLSTKNDCLLKEIIQEINDSRHHWSKMEWEWKMDVSIQTLNVNVWETDRNEISSIAQLLLWNSKEIKWRANEANDLTPYVPPAEFKPRSLLYFKLRSYMQRYQCLW